MTSSAADVPPSGAPAKENSAQVRLRSEIDEAGATIRQMKSDGIKDKAALQPHIDKLLALKASWLELTGAQTLNHKP